MKLKSLLLGSAAALALATGAQAADPIVSVVSLDACDAFGISGLTISSDDTCLLISGEVSYEFTFGDFNESVTVLEGSTDDDLLSFDDDDSDDDLGDVDGDGDEGEFEFDWESVAAWELTFEATSETDMGMARAVVTLEGEDETVVENEFLDTEGDNEVEFSEAYVTVGDTTILSAGFMDSIYNDGDDESLAYLGEFQEVDSGFDDGDHGIALVSTISDGITVAVALENLDAEPEDEDDASGQIVGVIEVDQSWGSAHLSVAADDLLDGFDDSDFFAHAGTTLNFDPVEVVAAVAYDGSDDDDIFTGLLSAAYTFDMFTIAGHVEGSSEDEFGAGISAGADITETIAVNLGFRYFDENDDNGDDQGYQVEGELVAAIAENLEASATLGAFWGDGIPADEDEPIIYGSAALEYTPSDSVTIDTGAEVNSLGAYQLSFGASKSF